MISDTAMVYLHASASPYSIADSSISVINSAGSGVFNFNEALDGINYYIDLRHRNSIETWSKTTTLYSNSSSVNYNLSTALTQAYGNNLKQADASPVRYAVFSGDVNQDGTIDLSDGSLIDNDAFNFASGYLPTDVNGDQVTDLADAVFADNNAFNFVGKITP